MSSSSGEREAVAKSVDSLWTKLLVDPLATPLSHILARRSWVTPNRVSAFAGVLGLVSATLFATGHLRWGGAVFIVRFVFDCVDGKVARIQGTSSYRGGALDQLLDVCLITLNFAALAWYLTTVDLLPVWGALAIVVLSSWFSWLLAFRKQLAAVAGLPGDGGAGGMLPAKGPLAPWVRWCERRGYMPVPYSVEAEQLTLGVVPLVAPGMPTAVAIWICAGFYALAVVVNTARVWRLAASMDREKSASSRSGSQEKDTPA